MNIESLTIGQAREIAAMFPAQAAQQEPKGLNSMIGQQVIIRTYSAGVHFGTLAEKSGDEVILKEARRMWRWKAKKSISLSGCALYGIDESGSRIAPPVPSMWLEAIEIIPCSAEAIISISGAAHAEAQ